MIKSLSLLMERDIKSMCSDDSFELYEMIEHYQISQKELGTIPKYFIKNGRFILSGTRTVNIKNSENVEKTSTNMNMKNTF